MRVLLVDDHPLFLDGLQHLLTSRGIEVLGTARDGLEALEKARKLRPDVVLMDISMPRCDGLAATRLIKAELPETTVIMLTVSANDDDLFEAIKCGASGYLFKGLDVELFLQLLNQCEKGCVALAPGLGARLFAEFSRSWQRHPDPQARHPQAAVLSPRQLEILSFVARGLTYKKAAEALCLSERTIKYHMSEIMQRLHVGSRSEVIAYAVREGLSPR